MKILLINDPGIPVPPKLYGGIERIVFQLANEYLKEGHEVTLLAGPDSFCDGNTIIFGQNSLRKSKWQVIKEVIFVWKYLWLNRKKYDLVHSFGRLIYLIPILNRPIKKIMSYQREVTIKNIQLVNKLPNRNLYFTGCSDYISRKQGLVGNWNTVYNFVDLSKFEFKENVSDDAPFIFLGRIERIKGCHHCIQLAKDTGRRLLIAGNISEIPKEIEYFENEIKPFIDGEQIKYVGAVNDEQKNYYLGQSLALLMLIDWDEPFGIVMVESLACGTPVVGFSRGAVNEVVSNGFNGLIIEYNYNPKKVIGELLKIDRGKCIDSVLKSFTSNVISTQYLNIGIE